MKLYKKRKVIYRKETIDKSADPMAETLKLRLDYLTFDAPEEEFKPEEVKRILDALDKCDPITFPEGTKEEEILRRFEQKNHKMIVKEEKKALKEAKEPNAKKLQIAAAVTLSVLCVPVIGVTMFANNDKALYEIVEEENGELVYGKKKDAAGLEYKIEDEDLRDITLEQLKAEGIHKLYLPLKLMQDSDHIRLSVIEKEESIRAIRLVYKSDEADEWFKLFIYLTDGHKKIGVLGSEYRVFDVDLGWKNERLYYNPETGIVRAAYETGGRIYNVEGTMPFEEVIELIRTMEEV